MNLNITEAIISWLISRLGGNDRFRQLVKQLADEYYIADSLKKYRIWGDPTRLSIGNEAHLNDAVINTVSGKVVIGHHAFLGHGVSLLTGTHDYNQLGLDRQTTVPEVGRDIIIGNGAWIASNATVIGPCEIGENAVVGAGSVVTGNVAPNSIYAGVPAKFIRNI